MNVIKKTRLEMARVVGCVLLFCSCTALAQVDEGVATVLKAQAEPPSVSAPTVDDVQAVLSDWVYSKGWSEGWDAEKNRMILIEEVSGRIRTSEGDFLAKRAALYQEAELKLKARIIETFFMEVDASVIIDVPGNPIAAQMEAITDEYEESLAQARYAVEDAAEDYADILDAADTAIADELEGVTLIDRINAILDGIAKKLDEEYSSEAVAADKRARANELRGMVDEAQANLSRAMTAKAEIERRASEEVKAIQGDYAQSQTTSVKSFSKMPLLGAVVLKTAEAYDGRRDYRVGAVMAWSPKLQAEAAAILLGNSKPKPRPNKQTFDEWIAALDLSSMIGTRRYLAADGSVNFIGFAAVEYDPNDVGKEKTLRDKAMQQARGMAVLSMTSNVEVARLAETQTFGVDGEGGREDFTFSNMAQKFVQDTDGAVVVQGMNSPSARRVTHKPSGKPTFVAYAYINSDAASKSEAFREETYALKRWINKDQAERAGREAGMRAAADDTKNDPGAYREGYMAGETGVIGTDAANQAAAAPQKSLAANDGAAAQGQGVEEQEAEAGTFMDDSDVDDDF